MRAAENLQQAEMPGISLGSALTLSQVKCQRFELQRYLPLRTYRLPNLVSGDPDRADRHDDGVARAGLEGVRNDHRRVELRYEHADTRGLCRLARCRGVVPGVRDPQ